VTAYVGVGDGSDGSWPGLVGPGSGGVSRDAIASCAMAATVINTKSTMITIKVGRRTDRG
jgi:hypothetical protein